MMPMRAVLGGCYLQWKLPTMDVCLGLSRHGDGWWNCPGAAAGGAPAAATRHDERGQMQIGGPQPVKGPTRARDRLTRKWAYQAGSLIKIF
jgi:hypothetical protein